MREAWVEKRLIEEMGKHATECATGWPKTTARKVLVDARYARLFCGLAWSIISMRELAYEGTIPSGHGACNTNGLRYLEFRNRHQDI